MLGQSQDKSNLKSRRAEKLAERKKVKSKKHKKRLEKSMVKLLAVLELSRLRTV